MELQQLSVVTGLPYAAPPANPLLTLQVNYRCWNPHLGACFCRLELRHICACDLRSGHSLRLPLVGQEAGQPSSQEEVAQGTGIAW